MLEPESDPSTVTVNEDVIELFDELSLDPSESIFLFGGYTGESWLLALDSYYPSHDVIKSLSPMNSVRSYASVAQLNGDLYIIGGGNGNLWYDTGMFSHVTLCFRWELNIPDISFVFL